MTRGRILTMSILTAIGLVLAAQAEAPRAPAQDRVDLYASHLKDETKRDRARDRLVHLGRPAVARLEKLGVDPALLASIREEVAFNESLAPAYGAPHLFNFDGSEETLGVLLSKLEAGSGSTLQKNSIELSQKLSLRLEDATFWEALDEICRKASLSYYPYHDPIYLNGQAGPLKPRTYYGPLLISIDRMLQQRRVLFDHVENDFTIKLICSWERHIAPLGLTMKYKLAQVVDDTGLSLLPTAEKPAGPVAKNVSLLRTQGQIVDLSGLRIPSADAKKLARVEGTLEMEFPARVEEVRFEPGEALPQRREIEGATIELKSFNAQTNWAATAEFAIRFAAEKDAAGFKLGMNDIDFIIPGDTRRSGWINSARLDKETYSFTAHWRSNGRPQETPKEIRVRIPRGSVIKNVPFSFRDVELK